LEAAASSYSAVDTAFAEAGKRMWRILSALDQEHTRKTVHGLNSVYTQTCLSSQVTIAWLHGSACFGAYRRWFEAKPTCVGSKVQPTAILRGCLHTAPEHLPVAAAKRLQVFTVFMLPPLRNKPTSKSTALSAVWSLDSLRNLSLYCLGSTAFTLSVSSKGARRAGRALGRDLSPRVASVM
jgi:hypothetical protein